MKILENELTANHTSFKVGGPADKVIIADAEEELAELLREFEKNCTKHMFIGKGSNTLFTDDGYDGTIVKLGGEFSRIEVIEEDDEYVTIRCGTATAMSDLRDFTVEKGFAGFEKISGIPGSIGGALYMNAGAYEGEMSQVVLSAKVMSKDGNEIYTLPMHDLKLGYRTSRLHDSKEIALYVDFRLKKSDACEVKAETDKYTAKREEKQPLEYPSAGSFFKRPKGYYAGQLIDESGLRGKQIGGAQVSEKHCGFIINKDNATAGDVMELMKYVQDKVYEKFGVKLEPEVRIIRVSKQE